MEYGILFFCFLFVVAFLYASVGHGGASGYLGLMALWGVTQDVSKPVALVLNCVVSLIAFLSFYRAGYFNRKIFSVLALASIPAAFVGSLIPLNDHVYKIILGGMLCVAASRLLFIPKEPKAIQAPSYVALLVVGALIGFVSGMIGIGGGIILSPLLILCSWSTVKETSGISALFILVNSMSALVGLYQKGIHFTTNIYWMIAVALLGGIVGATLGAKKMPPEGLKKLLALGLLIASLKLFFL
jgi:hypothetical protein